MSGVNVEFFRTPDMSGVPSGSLNKQAHEVYVGTIKQGSLGLKGGTQQFRVEIITAKMAENDPSYKKDYNFFSRNDFLIL